MSKFIRRIRREEKTNEIEQIAIFNEEGLMIYSSRQIYLIDSYDEDRGTDYEKYNSTEIELFIYNKTKDGKITQTVLNPGGIYSKNLVVGTDTDFDINHSIYVLKDKSFSNATIKRSASKIVDYFDEEGKVIKTDGFRNKVFIYEYQEFDSSNFLNN